MFRIAGRISNPRGPRIRTHSDSPYASRSFVKSETLRDISESTTFSLGPRLPVPVPGCTKARVRLDIARGRFPKEFAINASSPHCASICFRLSTRGRRDATLGSCWWKQTSVSYGSVCDFLPWSCVFPRKWRRIDRTYHDPFASCDAPI